MAKRQAVDLPFKVDDDGYVNCTCSAKVPVIAAESGYGTKHGEMWSCPACDEAVAIAVKKELEELPF
jgi:hypothetical protein